MKKLHYILGCCSGYMKLGFLLTLLAVTAMMLFSCSEDDFDTDLGGGDEGDNPNLNIPGVPKMLTDGLYGSIGSTIGPDGGLYVVEGEIGQITRVDIETGDKTVFASGLPKGIIGIGGVIDLAFLDGTAYALVTLVGDQFGGSDVAGIYRVDGPTSHKVIADIGAFALANQPSGFDFVLERGLQFAMEVYRGGFLVTDGHHNRVYYATLDGTVTGFKNFRNNVPTGLEVREDTIYMAESGPIPHNPETGKVVSFDSEIPLITEVASGAPLLVDVEFDNNNNLYALSQGEWEGGEEESGMPGLPKTGSLVRVNEDGTMTRVIKGLNLPTSLEFVQSKAIVVNLLGEVWTIDPVITPTFEKR